MAWLSGWLYRRAVTITEQSGGTLTDYQVRIELNSSNFDFSKANADGSDIRFTADDGETLLPYWIEKWDSSNEEAVIWVKVPSILANSDVTIYIYYGNPSAVSESDGDSVFEFFDDFEGTSLDTSKWTGDIDKVEVLDGILHGLTSSSWNVIIHTEEGSVLNKVVESRAKVTSVRTKPVGPTDGTRGAFFSHEADGDDRYQVWDGSNWYWTTNDNAINENVWDVYTIIVFGDGSCKYINSLGEALSTDFTSVKLQNTGTVEVWLVPGASYFDWVRVRKYAEQEPTVTVGSEEMPPVKYWDGSAWKDIKAIYYWDGSSWVKAKGVYYWNGSQWVKIF